MPPDIDTLRKAYEALNRGEWDRTGEFMEPNITWSFVEGQGPEGPQTIEGPSAIVDFWEAFFEAWDEWEMSPQDFIETPEGTILVPVHFRAKGAGSGFPLELDYCQVITMRDGRIYNVDQYLSRESATQACGMAD